jgi:hypothetical protein
VIFYELPCEPLALLPQRFYREKLSAICVKEKFLNNATHIHLIAIVMKTQATTHCCLKLFFGGNPFVDDIFGPQLVVVSGLFVGNSFVDGNLGHNLLLSRAFSVGIPSWMGF